MITVLMTVDRPLVCRRITREVEAAADQCRDYLALDIRTELHHRHLPPEHLRRHVDVLVVDGHGHTGGLAADVLLRDHVAAVVAPVLITGWCWAMTPTYRAVLACCIAVPHAVQIGSVHRTEFADARIVYPPVFDAVACRGTDPERLLPVLQPLLAGLPTRRPWTATVLSTAASTRR